MSTLEPQADQTLLVIGHYLEDTRSLLKIVGAAQETYRLSPIFLITSTADLREQAIQAVREGQYRVFDEPQLSFAAEAGIRTRVPYLRIQHTLEANIALSKRILEIVRPAAILCSGDAAGGTLVKTARLQGIPSLFLQWTEIHSLEVHKAWQVAETRWCDRQYPLPRRFQRRLGRFLDSLAKQGAKVPPLWPYFIPATYLAVAGPFYKSMCVRAGIPPEKVVVTGNPQCDDMYQYGKLSPEDKAVIRRDLGISNGQRFILYAREHVGRIRHLDPGSALESERLIMLAMRHAAPEYVRVVRLHPKEGAKEHARIRGLDPNALIIGNDCNIGKVIAAADLVISTVSSSLLWALGIDTPAISAFLWRGVDEFKMRRHWVGVENVDTFDELVAAIDRNVHDSAHQQLWRQQRARGRSEFLVLDGKCTERIVRHLGLLLKREVL